MEIKNIPETWWHRLLNISFGFFWLFASLTGAYIAWACSQKMAHYYSWRLPYTSTPNEMVCSPTLYSEIIDSSFFCGEFHDARSAVDDMISASYLTRPEQVPSPRNSYSDAQVLLSVAAKQPLKTSWEMRTDWKLLWRYSGYAVLFSIGLWLVLFLAEKLIFYIAYGARHRIIR